MWRKLFFNTRSKLSFYYFTILFIFLLIINTFSSVLEVSASQSGIYIDNGVDQTIMHRTLDETDKMHISDEILEFLGLSERPKSNGHSHLSLR